MKKLILKCLIIVIPLYLLVVLTNYLIDPANLFNDRIIEEMSEKLLSEKIIESPGDVGEGELLEKLISGLSEKPGTVAIGSSHIMYIDFDYENCYTACLSGAYLGDYFAMAGLLEEYDKLPSRIIIGVDPWAFISDEMQMRHTSLESYRLKELARVHGEDPSSVASDKFDEAKEQLNKYKELFSFSYFQSAFKNIRNGSTKIGGRAQISVFDNDEVEDRPKILPNGRRVMNNGAFHNIEQNDASALSEIQAKTMYQLYGFNEISQNNCEDFKGLVKHFTDMGCEVDLYLAPWYPTIYEAFGEGNYNGVFEVEKMVLSLQNEEKVTVRGSYNPNICRVTKEDYADCFHLIPRRMLDTYKLDRSKTE